MPAVVCENKVRLCGPEQRLYEVVWKIFGFHSDADVDESFHCGATEDQCRVCDIAKDSRPGLPSNCGEETSGMSGEQVLNGAGLCQGVCDHEITDVGAEF